MINEQTVRAAIDELIERKELTMRRVEAWRGNELRASRRLTYEVDLISIQHSIDTLIELQYILRLCGCPASAYQQKEVSTAESK